MNWRWQPRLRTTIRHIAGSASWWSLSMLIGVGLKQGAALCFGQKIWMDLEVSVGYTYTLTTHMTRDSFAQCNNGQRTESYRRRRWKVEAYLQYFIAGCEINRGIPLSTSVTFMLGEKIGTRTWDVCCDQLLCGGQIWCLPDVTIIPGFLMCEVFNLTEYVHYLPQGP